MALNTKQITAKIAHRIRAIIVEQTIPVKTGELRRSIHVSPKGDSHIVGTNKKYARAVHEGRKEMEVRPKRAKALKFKRGGKTVYYKKVTLPPIKPRPYLQQGLKKFIDNADSELKTVLPQISKDFRDMLAYELRNIKITVK